MAQRIKKQFFKILPVSVVGLMVFAMVIGVWQGLPTNKAQAVVATVVSAKVTSPTQITVVYTVAVDAVVGNYSNLIIDATPETSVDSMTGTGTITHVITFTPDIALTSASTGVVDIAALVDLGSTNTFVGQVGQVLTDGQAPVITGVVITAGAYKIGSVIPVTINADAAGYTAGAITINGQPLGAFADATGGVYTGTYTVVSGDVDRANVGSIPVSVVLIDAAANSSAAYVGAPTSGGAVTIDANAPVITGVVITAGAYKIGSVIPVTINADAAGYTAGAITINGQPLGAFADATGGVYTGTYTVVSGDVDRANVGSIPVSVVLIDAATNSSAAYVGAPTSGGAVTIDANAPTIASVTSDAFPVDSLRIGEMIIFTVTPTIADAGLTINAATYNTGALAWGTADGGTTYTATYTILEGEPDRAVPLQLLGVTATDAAGNISALVDGVDVAMTIDANSPIIGSVAVAPDAVTANVGDAITATITAAGAQADLSLAGACTINTVDVSGSFVNNADGTYTLTYNVSEGDGDVGSGTLAISCALEEPSLNTVTASLFDANTLEIDANSPTSMSEDVYSDNTFDTTLAGVGKVVIVEVTPSETLLSLSVDFTNPGFGVIPAVDDGTGCDALGADDIWTACAPVTGNPPDSDAVADFTIDMTDLAGNPASILSGALLASVTVDTIAPSITQIKALLQDGNNPAGVTNNWYYYAGQNIRFSVTSDQPLSALKACTQSLANDDMTDLCSVVGPNDFETGILDTDYINFTNDLGGNEYEFILPVATFGVPTLPGGYGMNLYLVDESGNATFSTAIDGSDSFAGVFGINPADGSIDASLLAPPSTTTDWSTIVDFTNVTGLKFEAYSVLLGEVLGSLTFPGSINLTASDTITALQSFSANVLVGGDGTLDADGTADISIDSSALAALDVTAELMISLPLGTTVQPGMVVYNNDGSYCDTILPGALSDADACGNNITAIDFDDISIPPTLTFTTDGFSGFGVDDTAPINQDTVFASNISRTVNTAVTIVSSGDAANNVWFAPSGTTNFVAGATMTKAASGTATTISAPSVVSTYKLYVIDSAGNVSAPSTATLTTTAVSGGGGDYTPPADNTLPVATSISIAGGAAQTSSLSVTLALSATNSAQMMISNTSDFAGAVWETYAASKAWTLTANFGAKTVYAKFKNTAGSISSVILDTIDYVEVVTIIETPIGDANLITQDPAPAPALPPQVTIGSLVKRADMTSVYFIDQDNRRHAFPNSAVYLSYYPDFSGIQTISAAIMASIPLGNNVTMRPGTYLVKIQSDPKVYAVAPYGVLKWVTTEQLAVSLYGSAWATRIIDVEPTFFGNYQIGSSITTAVHPAGSAFSYQGDSKVYYVEGGKKRYVSPDVFISNKFQNMFISRNISSSIAYPDGVDLPSQGMEVIMTLR